MQNGVDLRFIQKCWDILALPPQKFTPFKTEELHDVILKYHQETNETFKILPKVRSRNADFDGEKKFSCSQCDFVMYQNINAAAVCSINKMRRRIITNQEKSKILKSGN